MEPQDEAQAVMVLNALPDFGPVGIRKLVQRFGSARAVLAASAEALEPVLSAPKRQCLLNWRERFDLGRELERLKTLQARFIPAGDAAYPSRLQGQRDAPVGLYQRGEVDWRLPAVAIVGTRGCSQYGRKVAYEWAKTLAANGVIVVSGLALGVDAYAHQGALDGGGKTVGVLGNGLDVVYPRENRELYARMAEEGALLTEFYLGRKADRQTFPQRNRIVAGISQATLVIETDERGGSLITARFALEQGRTVLALPGRIDQPTSKGCHMLIREGAILVTSPEEVLEELSWRPEPLELDFGAPEEDGHAANMATPPAALEQLDPASRQILELLAEGEVLHVDQLSERLDRAPAEVGAQLMLLEIEGWVSKRFDGTYEKAY
ncbi:MAG: DNA-processing protein DprA [Verrucomicrobiota bacterium JB022]|nr:DNA-processing protein DprA [Verrucomicrobiota bacterium JB022]